MIRLRGLSAMLLMIASAVFGGGEAFGQATPGRLVYEMVVTAPGTRSQGWHGVLYGHDGVPMRAAPNAVIATSIGSFRNVPCAHAWSACGMIRLDSQGAVSGGDVNALIDDRPWTYRLYVHAEGSKSEGWRGVLYHGDELEPALTLRPIETPMGRFRVLGDDGVLWGWAGWFPEGWLGPDRIQEP